MSYLQLLNVLIKTTQRLESITDSACCCCNSYSTIAWTASVEKGVQPNVDYSYKGKSRVDVVFNFFSVKGIPGLHYVYLWFQFDLWVEFDFCSLN